MYTLRERRTERERESKRVEQSNSAVVSDDGYGEVASSWSDSPPAKVLSDEEQTEGEYFERTLRRYVLLSVRLNPLFLRLEGLALSRNAGQKGTS